MTATPTPDSRVRGAARNAPTPTTTSSSGSHPTSHEAGSLLPTREARDVGASIRFELALLDDTLVFAGQGIVTWAKPKGMGVQFTELDSATAPMLRSVS